MKYTYALCAMLLVLAGCQNNGNNNNNSGPCTDFNNITITGPTVAYLDSSFTLKATDNDDAGYEWEHESFTSSVTATSEITISPVTPQSAGQYTLFLYGYDCGDRTLTHTVEVRPKPVGNSPCTTTLNTAKANSLGQYTYNSIIAGIDNVTGYYEINAYASGFELTIKLPLTAAPQTDYAFDIENDVTDYKTAAVTFVGGGGISCYFQPSTNGKLYVKKVTGGFEYSFCGVSFQSNSGCVNINTPVETKFKVQ